MSCPDVEYMGTTITEDCHDVFAGKQAFNASGSSGTYVSLGAVD